jgi:hypothetical protein
MIAQALAFGEAGFPIIPVRLSHDGERWRKLPLTTWDQATSNEVTIEWFWRKWPDALPGIPLARMNWAVVDADRRDGVDGVAQVTDLDPLGPHSRIATPSGGLHLVFAQPNPPIHGRFKWCEGVEVLGQGCLLTCYDLEELKFPDPAWCRTKLRAPLPKMFWQPRDDVGTKRSPTNKDRARAASSADAVYVADLTKALRAMDPCDWRGEHDEWLMLMAACQAVGIACEDFVTWSVGDPQYAGDAQLIRRKWKSLKPGHGGALFAALATRGIKVRDSERSSSLIGREPLRASTQPTRNWHSRTNTIREKLKRTPTEGMLFSAACVFAEVMAQCKKPTLRTAVGLLEGDAKDCGLWKQLGPDSVRRTIANGLRHVEEKVLAATEEN